MPGWWSLRRSTAQVYLLELCGCQDNDTCTEKWNKCIFGGTHRSNCLAGCIIPLKGATAIKE